LPLLLSFQLLLKLSLHFLLLSLLGSICLSSLGPDQAFFFFGQFLNGLLKDLMWPVYDVFRRIIFFDLLFLVGLMGSGGCW